MTVDGIQCQWLSVQELPQLWLNVYYVHMLYVSRWLLEWSRLYPYNSRFWYRNRCTEWPLDAGRRKMKERFLQSMVNIHRVCSFLWAIHVLLHFQGFEGKQCSPPRYLVVYVLTSAISCNTQYTAFCLLASPFIASSSDNDIIDIKWYRKFGSPHLPLEPGHIYK